MSLFVLFFMGTQDQEIQGFKVCQMTEVTKKLLGTSASLLVTSALLVVTISYERTKGIATNGAIGHQFLEGPGETDCCWR